MPQWISELWQFFAGLHFVDWKVTCALAPFALVLIWLWKELQHTVAHTSVHKHKVRSFSLAGLACGLLLVTSWWCFSAAQGDPQVAQMARTNKYDAREFLTMIDRSGSMQEWDIDAPELAALVDQWEQNLYKAYLEDRARYPLLYPNPPKPLPKRPDDKPKQMIQRFMASIYVAERFLKSRPESDRFGMFTFDDRQYRVEPLGKDRNLLIDSLREVSREGGGGTNIDGAVQKAIDHFQRLGKTRVKTMVFISDGDAGITPERHDALVEQMKQPGEEIHIYFLLTGPKESMTSPVTESMRKLVKAVNPDDPNRPEFQNTVIWAGDGKTMQEAFALIDRLETSSVESDPVEADRPVRHHFNLAGCILLGLFMGLCSLFREEY